VSRPAALLGALAALIAFTLGGCANNIQRSAKLECARLRHLQTLKVARVDQKTLEADCNAA
jgi:hypothetical protein